MTSEERAEKAEELIEKLREQGLVKERENCSSEDLLAVLQMVASSLLTDFPGHRPVLCFEHFHRNP